MYILFPKNYFRKISNKGFTIVELIIVIAIAGILASIAAPSALKWVDREKQNSYIRELISYLELVKKETRRWNGSCTLQTKTFYKNPYDFITKKFLGVEAFTVRCFGMNNSEIKTIVKRVPKIEHKVFQEVNLNTFSFTPKGHLSIPGNQDKLLIIVGGRTDSDSYQKPKCILLEAPIGMINTGVYQNNMRFYSGRFGSRQNSGLRGQTCLKL